MYNKRYNTGNPVGSSDPRDSFDDKANFDIFANSNNDTYSDRLGVNRYTMTGMQNIFKDALQNIGFQNVGDYTSGLVITSYNQTVRDADGGFWRISGQTELPYTTTGAGLPEDGAFFLAGDIDLRSDLSGAPSSGLGAMLVNGAVVQVATIADLRLVTPAYDGQQFEVLGHTIPGIGGGIFYHDSASSVADDNGFTIVTAGGKRWIRRNDCVFTPDMYGAIGNGTADCTAAVTKIIAKAGKNQITGSGTYKTTALVNNLGADFSDDIRILNNGSLYNTYAHRNFMWGHEHLYGHYNRVRAKQNIKIVFSGDSTTYGEGPSTPENNIDQVFLRAASADGFSNVTVVNHGRPTFNTEDWNTTYAAIDIAANPNVLVLRWGLNDSARTLEQFNTSLRSGLTKVRNAFPLTSGVSIILMTPNSTDEPAGPRPMWLEEVQKIVRRAARDFHCGFIDTYGLLQNGKGYVGTTEMWMDVYNLHPVKSYNWILGSFIYDMLLPVALRSRFGRVDKTFSYKNSWVAPAFPYDALVCFKSNGLVNLKGSVRNGTMTTNTVIATLPEGYRPNSLFSMHPVPTNNGTSWSTGTIGINPNGDITIMNITGNSVVSFDGISFKCD